LVKDPDLADLMIWYPAKLYQLQTREEGETNTWVWEESHLGDDWWEIQVLGTFFCNFLVNKTISCLISICVDRHKFGPDGVVTYLQIYVDETQLTIIGNVNVWPVYAWLGNVPSAYCRVLIGYLPRMI